MLNTVLFVSGLLVAALFPILGSAAANEPELRVELDRDEAVTGQPITLRVTVLVPTWLPAPPIFPSFEVPDVSVQLPPRATAPTSERIAGESWSGVTRALYLYPMVPGRYVIPSQSVVVTFADPKTRQPVKRTLATPALSFEAIVPPGAEGLEPFIAAQALTLEQEIPESAKMIRPGDTFVRTVTAKVEGTLPLFLPPLIDAGRQPGFATYAGAPMLSATIERNKTSGTRVESVTVVAEAGGSYTAPPVELRWFNLKSKSVEIARLPGFAVVSDGPPPAEYGDRNLGLWVIFAALSITGLMLLIWITRRSRPLFAKVATQLRKAWSGSENYAFRRLGRAIDGRNVSGLARSLETWTQRLPESASTAESGLSEALFDLGRSRYGSEPQYTPEEWRSLSTVLRSVRADRLSNQKRKASNPLSPLNPM